METLKLKYGCNPNQGNACIYMENNLDLPIKVLNGQAGYINLLDALNGWQLVSELKRATNLPAATSFKHVSPAGAAIGLPLNSTEKSMYHISDKILDYGMSELSMAYARARGTDRMSSFGDFIALSDKCDVPTAMLIKSEVSDGIIAPSYEEEALNILKAKKNGKYTIVKIDENYKPFEVEKKQVFGITFQQNRNNVIINKELLKNVVTKRKDIPDFAIRDLLISLITLKYTQSNSVCYAKSGQTIGVGAGQQSRIHCTRLAGNKSDIWHLRSHEKVLNLQFKDKVSRAEVDNTIDIYISKHSDDLFKNENWKRVLKTKPERLTEEEKVTFLSKISDVSMGSDAFFPFSDNIERARKSGVKYIAQPGGSIRDQAVIDHCNDYDIRMVFTNTRLFHH